MKKTVLTILVLTIVLVAFVAREPGAETLRIASKTFTESVLLGELAAQSVRSADIACIHQAELGGTRILWNALRGGDIDAYPDYTGTIAQEILAGEQLDTPAAIREAVETRGLRMTAPIGFNNTYVIGVRRKLADRLNLRRISDLRAHPDLKLGFSSEFIDRADGWKSLQKRYRLPHSDVRGLEHELAYHALDSGAIDVTDLYATDAKISRYDFVMLVDDLEHFPEYQAVLLYRADLEQRAPRAVRALRRLEGLIDAATMIRLNAEVEIQDVPESQVAAGVLAAAFGLETEQAAPGPVQRLIQRTREHLFLVGCSMLAAVLVAVPLGVWAARQPRAGHLILGSVGIIQTIPSLALLVLLMRPLTWLQISGIGQPPALVALFLYSLLPMVRNTCVGLTDIPPHIRESAEALGLTSFERLYRIELPMASRTILAGIKTAAVINVGFATLGALIGAGGYGQPIITGIRLDDYGLILEGALPAAGLAVGLQVLFEGAERLLVPRGLRLSARAGRAGVT
jgi:osmoprotectant transport system permease protein